MKKISAAILAMFCFGIYAETNILCTTQPMLIFARAATKRVPGIKFEQMIPASTGCPHDYALTPSDMKKLTSANIIVMNGLGMEDFLEKAMPRLKKGTVLIDSSKGVKGILEAADHDHKHDHGECTHAKNNHLFAGPATASQVVRIIAEGFAEKDPKNTALYLSNAALYASELDKIAAEYKKFGSRIPAEKRNIAVQHSIFDYIADTTGLKVKAYLQKHTGADPSAAEIRDLIEKIKKENVFLIIAEKNYPDRVTKLVSKATGIPVLTLEAYPPNGNTDPELYLKMFLINLSKMKAAFLK